MHAAAAMTATAATMAATATACEHGDASASAATIAPA